jgi:hypothetical protein
VASAISESVIKKGSLGAFGQGCLVVGTEEKNTVAAVLRKIDEPLMPFVPALSIHFLGSSEGIPTDSAYF